MQERIISVHDKLNYTLKVFDNQIIGGEITTPDGKVLVDKKLESPWQFTKSNKGRMYSMLKRLADEAVTPDEVIGFILKEISLKEKDIMNIAKTTILQYLHELCGDTDKAKLNLYLLNNEKDLDELVYDMGVTLYDKHGIYEKGLINGISFDGDKVYCNFDGAKSDCDETLGLELLKAASLHVLVIYLKKIVEGHKSGRFSVDKNLDGTEDYVICPVDLLRED